MRIPNKYLLISTLIHITPLIILISFMGGGDGDKEEAKDNTVSLKIIENNPSTEKSSTPPSTGTIIIKSPKEKNQKRSECKEAEWYGGIGVYMTGNSVSGVAAGYPADEAGIEAGDSIIYPPSGEIKGEPGSTVELTVRKVSGAIVTLSVIREKICTGPKEKAND